MELWECRLECMYEEGAYPVCPSNLLLPICKSKTIWIVMTSGWERFDGEPKDWKYYNPKRAKHVERVYLGNMG